MQITNVFVSLLLAAAVSAKGDGTSVKAQCHQVEKLTRQSELAANATKLAKKFDNNQTAIDAFKAKVAGKATELKTLTSNTTLMNACVPIRAHQQDVRTCGRMQEMQWMIATAANDTKLQNKFKGNQTKITAFKAKASEAATKITALQSNQTLTTLCSVQADVQNCRSMKHLQKAIDMSTNQTALQKEFKGNQTKIDRFVSRVPQMKAKLDALKGNATLMGTCNSLSKAGAAGTNNAAAGKSAAGRVEVAGGFISAAVVAITVGMVML